MCQNLTIPELHHLMGLYFSKLEYISLNKTLFLVVRSTDYSGINLVSNYTVQNVGKEGGRGIQIGLRTRIKYFYGMKHSRQGTFMVRNKASWDSRQI